LAKAMGDLVINNLAAYFAGGPLSWRKSTSPRCEGGKGL